jgi:hypothetical protein
MSVERNTKNRNTRIKYEKLEWMELGEAGEGTTARKSMELKKRSCEEKQGKSGVRKR